MTRVQLALLPECQIRHVRHLQKGDVHALLVFYEAAYQTSPARIMWAGLLAEEYDIEPDMAPLTSYLLGIWLKDDFILLGPTSDPRYDMTINEVVAEALSELTYVVGAQRVNHAHSISTLEGMYEGQGYRFSGPHAAYLNRIFGFTFPWSLLRKLWVYLAAPDWMGRFILGE